MPSGLADTLARRTVPRLVVRLSEVTLPARAGAAMRRALGRRGRVELFVAFDDPGSAVALIDLAQRTAGRAVRLLVLPVVRRGIPGDPAVEAKRRYAVTDARRLARRSGLTLARPEPVAPQDAAFLAEWAAAGPQGPALVRFCVAAMRRLWFESDGPVRREEYAALWREHLGADPPADGAGAVRRDERRMRRRGPYDTPAAWIHGQWFFAQDRLVQIGERLDALGWTAA